MAGIFYCIYLFFYVLVTLLLGVSQKLTHVCCWPSLSFTGLVRYTLRRPFKYCPRIKMLCLSTTWGLFICNRHPSSQLETCSKTTFLVPPSFYTLNLGTCVCVNLGKCSTTKLQPQPLTGQFAPSAPTGP